MTEKSIYQLAYEAALEIREAAEKAPEITFPIEGYVITGEKTRWSQAVWSGYEPAGQEDVRLWIRPEAEGQVKAHVYRSTYGRPLHAGQDTLWVQCDHPECIGRDYEWQASHDRQYGVMEGNYLSPATARFVVTEWHREQQLVACQHIAAFLAAIGYTKDFVAEHDVEGFLAFLENLAAHVAEWEIEDHDEED